jgi:hypothetical protein
MSIHHVARRLAIGVSLLAVSACTTGPSLAAVQTTMPQVAPGNGRVWFIRQFEPTAWRNR